MKISRSNIIVIAKDSYKLLGETPKEKIDYNKWIEFIENHKDYFIWYENTEDGINALENIDKTPDWARERVLYSLNNKKACSTNKLVNHPMDFIVKYSTNDGMVSISIERKMSKEIAEILLEMARFLDGKLLIDGNKELISIEQLD